MERTPARQVPLRELVPPYLLRALPGAGQVDRARLGHRGTPRRLSTRRADGHRGDPVGIRRCRCGNPPVSRLLPREPRARRRLPSPGTARTLSRRGRPNARTRWSCRRPRSVLLTRVDGRVSTIPSRANRSRGGCLRRRCVDRGRAIGIEPGEGVACVLPEQRRAVPALARPRPGCEGASCAVRLPAVRRLHREAARVIPGRTGAGPVRERAAISRAPARVSLPRRARAKAARGEVASPRRGTSRMRRASFGGAGGRAAIG